MNGASIETVSSEIPKSTPEYWRKNSSAAMIKATRNLSYAVNMALPFWLWFGTLGCDDGWLESRMRLYAHIEVGGGA